MGRPLIATDVPGCREVVEHGRNGFLCPVRDPAGLAEQMMRMLDLPSAMLAQMGRESREKAEQEFDEQIVIHRYLEALGRVFQKE